MLNGDIEAILFNSSTHWFTIRKIDGIWFNLNSTNILPGPEIISDFYLSAFIQGSVDVGYTNFLVRNLPNLAPTNSDIYKNLDGVEKRLVTIEEILKAKEAKNAKSHQGKKEDGKKDEKEDAKFKAFQGQGVSLYDEPHNNFENDLDEETRKAIEMSLNDYMGSIEKNIKKEPEENDPDCYTISFKTADQTFTRRFYPNDTIRVIIFLFNINFFTQNYLFKIYVYNK
jgi:ataxin-3